MTKRLYAFSEYEFISLFPCTSKYFEEVMNNDAAVISISELDTPRHMLNDSGNVLNVEFGDDDSLSLETALRVCKFIQDNIGKNFYIHCSAGKSRSQGVVRYMLDVYPEVKWETRTDNPCITPNYHVVGQLKRSWMLLYNRNSD